VAAPLIIFDVDSTLLSVESLDFAVERALRQAPDGAARASRLSAITDQGMAGELDFRTSLAQRLAIAGLNRQSVAAASAELIDRATPGMAELLDALRADGRQVRAVSGGFSQLVGPALLRLGFSENHIYANGFVYDETGRAVDFDRSRATACSGGKADIVRQLKAELDCNHATMVGDGMTDFEAFEAGAADAFIGFGGVVERKAVKARAPSWARDIKALRARLGL
jgi:phosphoserine phosphatase